MVERSPTWKALIDVLVEARIKVKLTQRDLAARLGQPPSFVGKIESGSRKINVIEFVQVARALEVEPTKLLTKVIQATDL